MRQLTDSELSVMQGALREFRENRNGLIPKETRAFGAGFTAGLDAQAEQHDRDFNIWAQAVERLEAKNKRLREALQQIAAGQTIEQWLSSIEMAQIARRALDNPPN